MTTDTAVSPLAEALRGKNCNDIQNALNEIGDETLIGMVFQTVREDLSTLVEKLHETYQEQGTELVDKILASLNEFERANSALFSVYMESHFMNALFGSEIPA